MEGGNDNGNREELYSKSVRAGKRTYFFDVKSTKGKDLYLTITESKKKFTEDGKYFYEKHKLFLYKEDFEKFSDGLHEAISKIQELKMTEEFESTEEVNKDNSETEIPTNYSNVEFEDLEQNS